MSTSLPPRPRGWSCALLAGGLLLGACPFLGACSSSGITSPMEAQEKKEDEKAKLQYYTDAAKTYYEGGKYEAAVRMWEKVLAVTPDDQWAKFGLAKALHMTGTVPNLRRSEKLLIEVLPADWRHPTQGDVRWHVETALASVYSDLADFFDRDARILDARLEQEPSADAAQDLRVQKQTQIAKRNELLQRSVPLFERVLVASPEDPYALAGLAKAYLVLGNDDAGIGYANRYIALARRNQRQWHDKLQEWQKLRGRETTKEQRGFYAGKIQGARDKEKVLHLLLGSVYMRRDDFAEAISEYDAVIALDPATPPAYVERAQAYARLSQYPLAVRDLEEYLKQTDPVKQRAGRLSAMELLDRYRRLTPAGATAFQPANAPRSVPPPAPAFPPAGDIGSPDGPPAPPR